mmetsp:Transcript_22414/g.36246  ORF Transcript_22414/g.36246 Transcript_22414/m.36246 type:complete len:99 (+) Transcript_22414:123-419(+)
MLGARSSPFSTLMVSRKASFADSTGSRAWLIFFLSIHFELWLEEDGLPAAKTTTRPPEHDEMSAAADSSIQFNNKNRAEAGRLGGNQYPWEKEEKGLL